MYINIKNNSEEITEEVLDFLNEKGIDFQINTVKGFLEEKGILDKIIKDYINKEYGITLEDAKKMPEYKFYIHKKGLKWIEEKIIEEDANALLTSGEQGIDNTGAYIEFGQVQLSLFLDDCGGVKGSVGAGYFLSTKSNNNISPWEGYEYSDRAFYLEDINSEKDLERIMFYILMKEIKAHGFYWSKQNVNPNHI